MLGDIFLMLVVWFVIGGVGTYFIYAILDDFNPLWKILLILLGPFDFAIMIVMALVSMTKNYIKEVNDYYRRKDEKRRKNHEKDISSNRYAE